MRAADPMSSPRSGARRGCAAVAAGLLLAAIAAPVVGAGPALAATTPPSATVAVSVVVPLTATTTTGLIDAQTLAADTAPTGVLTRELAAVEGTTVTIAIDPMIIASINVLGSAAPPSAIAWRERLRAVSNPTFLLRYADADPAVAIDAGALDLLQPLDLGYAVDPTRFGPAATPTPTPSGGAATPSASSTPSLAPADTPTPAASPNGGPTPTAPSGATPTPTASAPPGGTGALTPLPTLDDLVRWSTTLGPIAWPAETGLSAAAIAGLGPAGYSHAIVSSTTVSPADTALVALPGVTGVVADQPLSTLVRRAAAATADASTASAALSSALTALATPAGRTVVATLDRNWATEAARLPTVLAALNAGPSTLVPLGQVLGGSPAPATPKNDADPARALALSSLATSQRAVETYSTVATKPLAVSGPSRSQLLALAGAGWAGDPTWPTQTAAFTTRSNATLTAVQIPTGSPYVVTASSVNLPVSVSNALPVPVEVCVTVVPQRPILSVTGAQCLTVDANSRTIARIPAQAVANGDVPVRISVTSKSTGMALGPIASVTVSLQAGWETVGILITVLVVVALFATGIVRSVLRRRRERRGADQEAPPGEASAGESTP